MYFLQEFAVGLLEDPTGHLRGEEVTFVVHSQVERRDPLRNRPGEKISAGSKARAESVNNVSFALH